MFLEKDFAKWFDGLEHELLDDKKWSNFLYYRGISLYDSAYNAIYFSMLNSFRAIYEPDNLFQLGGGNKIKTGKLVNKMNYLIKQSRLRWLSYLPPKRINPNYENKCALVVRGASNKTAFPVLRSLKEDFDWNVLFASWNIRLKNDVRKLGIDFIHFGEVYRRSYKALVRKHKEEVWNQIKTLDFNLPARSFSKFSGLSIELDVSHIFQKHFTTVRSSIDVYFNLIQNVKPNTIILFNESIPRERTAANVAKIMEIPTVFVQHGMLMGYVYRSLATDKAIVWGELPRQFWLDRGCIPDQIKCVGYYGNTVEKLTNITECPAGNHPTVLFIGQNPAFFFTLRTHKRTIRAVLDAAKQLPDINFVLKTHPAEDPAPCRSAIGSQGVENVELITEGSIDAFIMKADLVITVFSTSGIEAMLMGRPVLVLDLSEEPPLAPYAFAGFLVDRADKLSQSIDLILKDETLRQKLVENGRKFVCEYLGPLDGGAASRAADCIDKLPQNHRVDRFL